MMRNMIMKIDTKNFKNFIVFIVISKLFSRSGNSALFKRVVIYQLNFRKKEMN